MYSCLHVPVKDLLAVDEVETIEQLLHHFLDFSQAELDIDIGEETSQIMFTEVKHQVKCGLVPVVLAGFCTADLNQINNIFMSQ